MLSFSFDLSLLRQRESSYAGKLGLAGSGIALRREMLGFGKYEKLSMGVLFCKKKRLGLEVGGESLVLLLRLMQSSSLRR